MLNHDLVDGFLDRLELALQLSVFTGGNTGCDDGSGDVACSAESSFGFDKDVWDVLHMKVRQTLSGLCNGLAFSSQTKGRWRRISKGSVSAVRIMTSAIPRFKVFVAGVFSAIDSSDNQKEIHPR
jgi:hypothetical protein